MDKIWLKSYPPGVPAEINPDVCSSLVEMFTESCKRFADRPAFYNLGTTITYSQLDAYSRDFAAYLQQTLKLKKGDRFAIMLPNTLQYPIALFGALRVGLTIVNVNPLYTVPELIHQINDAGAETIIVLANYANIVQQAQPHTQLKKVIVTQVGDLLNFPKSFLVDFYIKYIKRKIPAYVVSNTISFKHALTEGKALSFNPVTVSPEDIAFLQYTGGTTGVAKGAMLTHRNLIANLAQASAWFKSVFQPGKEVMLTALPLYHIFAMTANCLLMVKEGGLNVLITNPRDLNQVIREMAKFSLTVITGVNTLFNVLLNHPKFKSLNFSQLKITLGGGMAVQRSVAEKWQQATGNVLLEAYGLTETSPCATINPPDLKAYNGFIGLPVSSTDVCILDDEGHELGINQPGELAIKGPQVMLGYWNNPAETAKVFKNSWLLTGDIASINENGFLRILERKKDMIIVSGFNVYPNEIEDALVTMPGIREAAVIGVSDEKSGEAVKAFIVKDNANLTAEDVIQYAHTLLTGYKIPKYIEFRLELPKTNVGKILRRALKAH